MLLDDFVNSYSTSRSRPSATGDNIANAKNWLISNPKTIDTEEIKFIYRNDLSPVVTTARTPLRRAFEKFEWFRRSRFFRHEPKYNENSYYNPEATFHQSEKRINSFVNMAICVIGFLMLIAPLWILLYLSTRRNQLAVITIFIALFLAVLQSVSLARPFESLAATAA